MFVNMVLVYAGPKALSGATYVTAGSCANPVGTWTATYDFAFVSDLTVAGDGSIYATGDFGGSMDFDPSDGVDIHTSISGTVSLDVFVTKLNPDGSYAWTRTFGSAGWDGGNGIAVGPDGSVWITGFFELSVDFDPGEAVDERISQGEADAFVSRFANDGTYCHTWILAAGDAHAVSNGIANDSLGNLVVVGGFYGAADFDPTDGVDLRTATRISNEDTFDAFLTKLAPNGSYLWTRTFGGTGFDQGLVLRVDGDNNVFVYGSFQGGVDFDPGEGEDLHTAMVPGAIFVTKVHPDGSYAWTRVLQVLLYDAVYDQIEVDHNGDVWIVGGFRNYVGAVDFDPTPEGVDERFTQGPNDVYVSKWHNDGSYAWTSTFAGNGVAYGVAPDSDGGVVVTGVFTGNMDFDPGPGVQQRTADISGNVFVTKLDGFGSWVWTRTMDGSNNEYGQFLTFAADGGLVVAGDFYGRVDFDPGCALDERVSNSFDGYIAKLGCVPVTADTNADGVVNLFDLAALQNCFSGSAPTICNSDCYQFDFDADDDIDLLDFAAFQRILTAP